MGFLHKRVKSANGVKLSINLWAPFLFSGIKIEEISENFRSIKVSLRQRFYNRNYFGTHFGGSLFAMVDPFFMLMVIRNLSEHYYVWDKQGQIEFVKPGIGTVSSHLLLNDEDIVTIVAQTKSGHKYEPIFKSDIINEQGEVIARYEKQLYIRLKPPFRP